MPKWWPFSKKETRKLHYDPKTIAKHELEQDELNLKVIQWEKETNDWVEEQKSNGIPLQKIYNELVSIEEKDVSCFEEWRVKTKFAYKILDIVVDRNGEGTALERAGNIDEAIVVYELNVADEVDTPHPYNRLRVLYTKRKQFDDAIRICEAQVRLGKEYGFDTGEYEVWLGKLDAKKERAEKK